MFIDGVGLGGDQREDQGFHLSLVMAGAVSAGAYTSGVLDFLIEAFEAWDAAKRANDPLVPRHDVTIDAVVGASAGSIAAGLLASVIRDDVRGVTSETYTGDWARSVLYRAWVVEASINGMLGTDDLEEGGSLKSLLNTVGPGSLDGMRDRAINVQNTREAFPSWLRDPLPIYLTTTNLRGVPYGLKFEGETGFDHMMTLHKEFARFAFGTANPDWIGHQFVNFADSGVTPAYFDLGDATLASGAFPGALRARRVSMSRLFHESAKWKVSKVEPDGTVREEMRPVKPAMPDDFEDREGPLYSYFSADGGALNNEPFEMARHLLADSTGRNAREADRSSRKLILIDPFPNTADVYESDDQDGDLLYALGAVVNAMKQQARLKVEDLAVIGGPGKSRYVIAPKRNGAGGEQYPLACGTLGAFGGFLHEGFRHHDYILGRRNAQNFLAKWFTVPVAHRLVDPDGAAPDGWSAQTDPAKRWTAEQIDRWRLPNDQNLVPIVPLIGELASPVAQAQWPRGYAPRAADLEQRIEARLKAVGRKLVRGQFGGGLDGFAAQAAVGFVTNIARKKVMEVIESNLRAASLW